MDERTNIREVLGDGGLLGPPRDEGTLAVATGPESGTRLEPEEQDRAGQEQLVQEVAPSAAETATTSKEPSRNSDVGSTGCGSLRTGNVSDPVDLHRHWNDQPHARAKWRDIWENTIKQLSFRSLLDIARGQSRVAIFKSRRAAFLAIGFHFIPIATSIGITFLTIRGTSAGFTFPVDSDRNFSKIIGLQIVAKVYELFVVASLTSMIFTLIRRELALKDGVPFAAVSAASNIGNAAFLWSKEFMALFRGDFASKKARCLLIGSIVVGVGMALAVAPAVATLIAPTMASWPVGGTSLWINASRAELFPRVVNSSNTLGEACKVAGHDQCPSAFWTGLRDIFAVPLSHRDTPREGLPDVGNFFWFRVGGGEAGITITNRVRNKFGVSWEIRGCRSPRRY